MIRRIFLIYSGEIKSLPLLLMGFPDRNGRNLLWFSYANSLLAFFSERKLGNRLLPNFRGAVSEMFFRLFSELIPEVLEVPANVWEGYSPDPPPVARFWVRSAWCVVGVRSSEVLRHDLQLTLIVKLIILSPNSSKSNTVSFWFRWYHELSNCIEDNLELSIVFLLQCREFTCELFVGCE